MDKANKGEEFVELETKLRETQSANQKLMIEVEELKKILHSKDGEVQMYKKWQDGDKYLRQDAILGEAVEEHRVKTMQAAEQERDEMLDAAHTTVKTLQEMIDSKDKQLRGKDEQIQKLRDEMKRQAE
jgi:hypothetical protein